MKSIKFISPYNILKNRNVFSVIILFSFLFIFMSSCKGQVKKENEKDGLLLPDTINKPQVNVKVNKQYDENGNIVKYDSSYFYVYKGNSGTIMHLNNDSVFDNFKSYFNIHFPKMFDKQNNNIFFNDSLFNYDFFNDDYFQKRFELNQKLFGDFYKQMDSLKGSYLKEIYHEKKLRDNR